MLALSFTLLLPGCQDDFARLEGDRLSIVDCSAGQDRVYEPLSMDFPFQAWMSLEQSVGMIDLRRDHRPATETNVLVVQFTDLPAALRAWQEAPDSPLPIDDYFIRLSLELQRTCPDSTTPLVGTDGLLYMDSFDTETGGWLAGHAVFDLRDARDRERILPPAGSGLRLRFGMLVRRGKPYQSFTR